ncbi:site-specific DNA-methyltransferase [Candidatus Pelagibacter sp.]|nr:site-specific DNA-methyltransferase [Candidatus Pelagibacter sp.]
MTLDYKIYTGDRIEFLNEVKNNSVQLIITSPPYNIGKSYEKKEPLEKYLYEQKKTLIECVKKLKDEGSLCWQVGNFIKAKSEIVPLDIMIFNICTKLGLKLRNRIIWHYEHGLHATKKFSGRYETIMWFTKSDNYYFDFNDIRVKQKYPGKLGYRGKNKGKYTGNINGKNPSDVWIFPNVKSNHKEKTEHPCQFPIELAERLILSMSKKNDLVLDPYAGAGTTLIAALKNNRKATGSEILKKYVDIINGRINLLKKGKLPYRDRNEPIRVVKGNSKLYHRKD